MRLARGATDHYAFQFEAGSLHLLARLTIETQRRRFMGNPTAPPIGVALVVLFPDAIPVSLYVHSYILQSGGSGSVRPRSS